MKRKPTMIRIVCFLACLLFSAAAIDSNAQEVFITIGGGDRSGVYFPAGLAMAKMLNAKRDVYDIRATVESTDGATFNIDSILAGYMEFGMTQSDKLYQAFNGLAEWAEKGPQQELRAVFSLHHEALTLVAAVDAGINAMDDLKGKTVSIGNPGPSQHWTVTDALTASGLDPKRDFDAIEVAASDAPALLQDQRIDAYFYTVGHPSETIRKALLGERQARLIPIAGPAIDQLISTHKYYIKATIPVMQLYPDAADQPDVSTFGVIATLCTSAKVPADVVDTLTKEVVDNLEIFRRQHPAFYRLTRKGMLEGLTAPLHPGALRYYKETGLID
jgi:TRAP transporter TAXI family solute receptor